MRRFFFWFGIVASGLAVLAVAGFVYLVGQVQGLDGSAIAFADQSVIAITTYWDADALLRRTSPELKQNLTDPQVNDLFQMFSTLGPLTSSQGCKGQVTAFATIQQGRRVTANLLCAETYATASATVSISISLSLLRIGDAWQVNGFRVNSSKFLAQQSGTRL